MVRFGFRECPGVAQITRDTLFVDTAYFNIHLVLPLATLKVSKVVAGAGRYTGTLGWLGKYRFHVSAPCLGRPLVIGIKSGEEWRRALERNAGR